MPLFRIIVAEESVVRRAKVFDAATLDDARDRAFEDDWRTWDVHGESERTAGIEDENCYEVVE